MKISLNKSTNNPSFGAVVLQLNISALVSSVDDRSDSLKLAKIHIFIVIFKFDIKSAFK